MWNDRKEASKKKIEQEKRVFRLREGYASRCIESFLLTALIFTSRIELDSIATQNVLPPQPPPVTDHRRKDPLLTSSVLPLTLTCWCHTRAFSGAKAVFVPGISTIHTIVPFVSCWTEPVKIFQLLQWNSSHCAIPVVLFDRAQCICAFKDFS